MSERSTQTIVGWVFIILALLPLLLAAGLLIWGLLRNASQWEYLVQYLVAPPLVPGVAFLIIGLFLRSRGRRGKPNVDSFD